MHMSMVNADQLPAAEPAFLTVTDLWRSFGGVQAVAGVSFAVPQHQIIGLIGPNGAGKSTVMNLIAGIEHPDRGSVFFDGADISHAPPHQVAKRGLIRTFQISSEFARLTVLENLMMAVPHQRGATFWGAMRGRRFWSEDEKVNLERAQDLLERFHLSDLADDYASDLSGGQKRILEIARSMMAEPKMLLLDEPFAGIAGPLARTVEEYLMALRDEGVTMIMAEHELSVIDRCSDSVVVMALGKVIATGRMEDVRQNQEVIDAYLTA